jgi:hypothetical protein
MLTSGTQFRGFVPDRIRRIFPAGKNPEKIHSLRPQVKYQNNKVQNTNKGSI